MDLVVHKLRTEDVEAVSRMEEASFSMPWSPEAFRELAEAPGVLYLVAELEGRVAGCCGMTCVMGEGNIDNVVVDPRCRDRGVAQAMLRELLARGYDMGIEAFTLEVRVGNKAAIHIYEKLGFVSEGVRPGFYERPKEDALIMWKRG